jgi:hypothetical protein
MTYDLDSSSPKFHSSSLANNKYAIEYSSYHGDLGQFIFSCFDDRNEHININITFLKFTNQEEFEDTKGTTRIRKSKDRQHNGQKKKDRHHNGQKKKDRQHNGQKKKDRQHNGQKKKDRQHNDQKKTDI